MATDLAYWVRSRTAWTRTGSQLALGVIASALYGLGVARSLMDLDERNASRYATTSGNLEFLTDTRLAEGRTAAAEGHAEVVRSFVSDVQNQISSEHQRVGLSLSAEIP